MVYRCVVWPGDLIMFSEQQGFAVYLLYAEALGLSWSEVGGSCIITLSRNALLLRGAVSPRKDLD